MHITIRKTSTFTAFIILSALPIFAYASEGCEKPKTAYDRAYCLAKAFVESDNQLNSAYSALLVTLDNVQVKELIQSQRKWLAYRDSQCLKHNQIDMKCNYELNISHAEFLRARIKNSSDSYACYWMENETGTNQWVLAPYIRTKQNCYAVDSCNGGGGASGGGCYKWATSPNGQAMSW